MNRERRHPLIPLPKQLPPSALRRRIPAPQSSITSGISLKPISRRQVFSASNANFHTIVRVAVRDPQPGRIGRITERDRQLATGHCADCHHVG